MAAEKTYYNPDTASDSSSSSGEEDENNSERMSTLFSKGKKVEIANGTDTYVLIGIQSERESRGGGEEYKIGLPGIVELELKRGKKEQEFISRVPWLRSQPHR